MKTIRKITAALLSFLLFAGTPDAFVRAEEDGWDSDPQTEIREITDAEEVRSLEDSLREETEEEIPEEGEEDILAESSEALKEEEEDIPSSEEDPFLPEEDGQELSESLEEDMDAFVLRKENEIIAAVITPGMSDVQKLEALAKYVAEHFPFGLGNSEYVLLKDGKGSDYAASELIASIAGRLNIPSIINDKWIHEGDAIYQDNTCRTSEGTYVIVDVNVPVSSETRGYSVSAAKPFLYDTVHKEGEDRTRILRSLYFLDEEIIIPESYPEEDPHPVTEIGANFNAEGSYYNSVFSQNTALKRLSLPKTVRSLSREALKGSFEVSVDSQSPYFKTNGDFLLSRDGKTLYRITEGRTIITVPDGVEELAEGLLFKNQFLKQLVLPEGVRTIGQYVLYNSNSVETVILPSSLTAISNDAMTWCTRAKFYVKSQTVSLGSGVFEKCSAVIGYPGSTAETQAERYDVPFYDISNPFPVQKIAFEKETYEVGVGDTAVMMPVFTPADGTYTSLTWTSSDPSVVTVNNGQITGRKAGTATVSVTTESGVRGSAAVKVVPSSEVVSILLSPKPLSLSVGTTGKLRAEISPAEASYHILSWTSDNPDIASVDQSGNVSGVKEGSTTIRVTSPNGKEDSVTVIVNEYVPVESMYFEKNPMVLHVGDSTELGLVLTPANASVSSLVFYAYNNDTGQMDNDAFTIRDNTIQANKKGSYSLNVSSSSGKTASTFLHISDSRYRVVVEKEYTEVSVGETVKLKASVRDSSGNVTSKSPEFMFFEESKALATLYSDGTFMAKKAGTAELWVYVKGENDPNNFTPMTVVITQPVTIRSLRMEESHLNLGLGEERVLNVITDPEDADRRALKWTSDHPEIASVDDNGRISAKGNGDAKITVTASSGKKTLSASCTVTVSSPITKLELPSEKTLLIGEISTLIPTILPLGAYGELEYLSDNPSVLLTDQNGTLTPLKPGSAGITARVKNNPGVYAVCLVNVKEVSAASIRLDTSAFETAVGRSREIHAAIDPVNTTDQTVSYSVSNPNIVSVSSAGLVTALAEGDTDIFAKTSNGKSAKCHVTVSKDEIRAEIKEPQEGWYYTGSAIKPSVTVLDGNRKLAEKTDYTVSWKDNKNAGNGSVMITMKGNYAGKHEVPFVIQPLNIQAETITVTSSPLTAKKDKTLKASVSVTDNGRKLKENTDYTVTSDKPITSPGTYTLTITGIGNYTGARTLPITVADSAKTNVSKLKISVKAVKYTSGMNLEKVLAESGFAVRNGSDWLVKDRDYTIENVQNCDQAGSCTFEIHGLGSFSGERNVSIKINGTSISSPKVSVRDVKYDGSFKTLQDAGFEMKNGEEALVEHRDYEILKETYANHLNAGTASVTVIGRGAYTGKRTVKFKIIPSPELVTKDKISVSSAPYVRGGAKPKVEIEGLVEGVDYKVSYKNNKNKGTGTAEISLLGNYKSNVKIPVQFEITALDLAMVSASAKDITANAKAGKYVTSLTLTDPDGKELKAGSDYDKNIEYYRVDPYGNRSLLDPKKDTAEAGMIIDAKVTGINNCSGIRYVRYHVYNKAKDLSAVQFEKMEYEYTGEPVVPNRNDFRFTWNGQPLTEGVDYRMVSVVNNVKKGTAKLTIQGLGIYGGRKTITFKIVERNKKKNHWKE